MVEQTIYFITYRITVFTNRKV